MNKTKKKGFTLIELLVVIAIIGLLATLSVVALNNARARARDSRRVSDIKQIQTALELYFDQNNNAYPTGGTWNDGTPTEWIDISDLNMEDFMNPIPQSPTPGDGNCTRNDVLASADADGNGKFGTLYAYASDGSDYLIKYCLGNETGGIGPDVVTAGPTTISQ